MSKRKKYKISFKLSNYFCEIQPEIVKLQGFSKGLAATLGCFSWFSNNINGMALIGVTAYILDEVFKLFYFEEIKDTNIEENLDK